MPSLRQRHFSVDGPMLYSAISLFSAVDDRPGQVTDVQGVGKPSRPELALHRYPRRAVPSNTAGQSWMTGIVVHG